MAEMISSKILTRPQAGLINTLFFCFYAVGQLINGYIGDRISPKRMIFIGVFISGAANLYMSFCSGYMPMTICWAVNGYALSMIWPPIVRIFSEMLASSVMMKCFTNFSSSSAIGALFSYLLSALMIAKFGWRAVFSSAAAILLPLSIVWLVVFGMLERFRDSHGVVDEWEVPQGNASAGPAGKKTSLIGLVLSPAVLLILIPDILHGVLKDGIIQWVPTFICDTFHTTPVLSVLLATVLPIVNVSGAYAAQFAQKRWFKNETSTAAFFFSVALVSLAGLHFFAGSNVITVIILLSIITSAMLAINTIFISFVPMCFSRYGRSASMSGFLNFICYMGSAISSISIGLLVSNAGWGITILSWCVISAVALVLCVIGRNQNFDSIKAVQKAAVSEGRS